MDLFKLFRLSEVPAPTVDHHLLGHLPWSEEDRAWVGLYNGFKFGIGYERLAQPSRELLNYALELMADRTHLLDSLAAEKQRLIADFPLNAEEIQPLNFDVVFLYRHKGVCRTFATLVPESERNSWRIEYQGTQCKGLGFDS